MRFVFGSKALLPLLWPPLGRPQEAAAWEDHEESRWELTTEAMEFTELDDSILDVVTALQWAKSSTFYVGAPL